MSKIVRKLCKTPICGIYSVTNILNNKIYIGQSIDIERRWYQHKYGKGNIILRNAIKKYGIENFKFEILDEIDSCAENLTQILIDLEQKWFNLKQPFKDFGYNIQKTSKPNITPNRNKHFGKKISKIKIDNNHCGKAIIQYNKTGDKIKRWNSAAEIERTLKFFTENISACCLGKNKSSHGFIWKFEDFELTEEIIKKSNSKERKTRQVEQLDLNDIQIRTFSSIKLAAETIGCQQNQISHTCAGDQKTCRGYKWRYID